MWIKAFSGDEYALTTLQNVIASDLHRDLPVPGRIFLYHPFHHAESVTAQDRGIELVRDMLGQYPAEWHAYIQQSVDGFTRHRNIVAQFGRFPHRNEILNRVNTTQEKQYLTQQPQRYGQSHGHH